MNKPAGYITISSQLLSASEPDFDRYIAGTLARSYGMEIDAETAAVLEAMDWRPQPYKRTLRDQIRGYLHAIRSDLAYRIAPWLPREEEW